MAVCESGFLNCPQHGQYPLCLRRVDRAVRQRQRYSAGAQLTVKADRALAQLRQCGDMLFHRADITARHWAGHAAGDTLRGDGSSVPRAIGSRALGASSSVAPHERQSSLASPNSALMNCEVYPAAAW